MADKRLKLAYMALLDSKLAVSNARPQIEEKIRLARLNVIGPGSARSSPALALDISRGNRRYVYKFNLNHTDRILTTGQGQRLRGIFFTRLSWYNIGLGMTTLLNSNVIKGTGYGGQPIAIHGPPGIGSFVRKMYEFLLSSVVFKKFFERFKIFDDERDHIDQNITVKKIKADPLKRCCDATVSYICTITDFRYYVFWDKLEEKYGTNFQTTDDITKKFRTKFYKFQNMLYSNKSAVHPTTQQEINPEGFTARENQTFVVVDCPTMDHFECLKKSETLKRHCRDSEEKSPFLIAHLTPKKVYLSESYQNWIDSFGPECDHLVMNDNNELKYTKDECIQRLTFNKISEKFFPPVYEKFIKSDVLPVKNHIQACAGMQFEMPSNGKLKFMTHPSYDLTEYESMSVGAQDAVDQGDVNKTVRDELNVTKDTNSSEYYPRLVTLGTGSSMEDKYRSQSGYLLLLDKNSSIVLDCGPRVLELIHMAFGEKAADILTTIKMVSVSHQHMDHHGGFFALMEELASLSNVHEIVCLTTPKIIEFYSDYFRNYATTIFNKTVFISITDIWRNMSPVCSKLENFLKSIDVKEIVPIPVQHSILTFGVSIVTKCGKKIVYSSDTLPLCKALIEKGQNADLLIHDCLYAHEEFKTDAKVRKHSYLGGTLATAEAMNAKFTLLSHFVTFLPVRPVTDIPEEYAEKVACAYDLLGVSLSDLKTLPKLDSAMSAVYWENLSVFESKLENIKSRRRRMSDSANELADLIDFDISSSKPWMRNSNEVKRITRGPF